MLTDASLEMICLCCDSCPQEMIFYVKLSVMDRIWSQIHNENCLEGGNFGSCYGVRDQGMVTEVRRAFFCLLCIAFRLKT